MLKLQTRHKYDSLEDYNLLLREIRKVEKEISTNPTQTNIQTPSSSIPATKPTVKHTPLSAESSFEQQLSALENKFDSKISSIETKLTSFKVTVEAKIDSKFDLILQKLENQGSSYRSGANKGYRINTNNNNNKSSINSYTKTNNSSNNNSNNNNNNNNYSFRSYTRGRGKGHGRYYNRDSNQTN